jgi:hypothetical protein
MRAWNHVSALLGVFVLASSCAGSRAAAPAPASANPAAKPPVTQPNDEAGAKMWHHFWDVVDARDAVIAGDLERVRPPLLRLAQAKHGIDDMPHDWLPWIDDMEAKAARAAQATTLAEAAHGVAAVTQSCGDCHRATRGGPHMVVGDVQEFDAHGRTGLRGAMAQHVWAAEELWLGMTVPHHESWAAGAKALASTPLPPAQGDADAPSDAATIDPELHQKLEAVRAMGDLALAAGQPAEMTKVYGELIARCGDCHAVRRHGS